MSQEWKDYKLAWNKSEYGNVQSIRIAPNDIWTPDILLYNRCEASGYTDSIGIRAGKLILKTKILKFFL